MLEPENCSRFESGFTPSDRHSLARSSSRTREEYLNNATDTLSDSVLTPPVSVRTGVEAL